MERFDQERFGRERSERPLTSLLSAMLTQVSTLIQAEVRLARAEMAGGLKAAGGALGLAVAGGLVAFAGFIVLLGAAVELLVLAGMGRAVAALLVAVVTLGLGGLAAKKGLDDLKARNLVPRRALGQVEADLRMAKEMTEERV